MGVEECQRKYGQGREKVSSSSHQSEYGLHCWQQSKGGEPFCSLCDLENLGQPQEVEWVGHPQEWHGMTAARRATMGSRLPVG